MSTRSTQRLRPLSAESGSADALALVLIAPAALGLAFVILFLSRGVDTRATAQGAAESAAQAAAQERSPTAAVVAGEAVAMAMLVDDATCARPAVSIDVSSFSSPRPVVRATVACHTSIAGLELIAPPSGRSSTYTAFAYVDPLRGSSE